MKLEQTNILIFSEDWPKEKIFHPAEFFKNNFPAELEIGCGKGKFLVDRAAESPEINFIGIDRAGKWMKTGDRRSTRRQLENLVFIKTEAQEFLKLLEPLSVQKIHMYFPDPWPKRRHRRRRLFTPGFLKILYDKMQPGGFLELATDDADYFQQMRQSIQTADILWKVRQETVNERICSPHIRTNYETKFAAAGRNLYYLELEK